MLQILGLQQEKVNMRAIILLLLALALHAFLSQALARPNFKADVNDLLQKMATQNGYTLFHKCHIVPWNFIENTIDNGDKAKIEAFIEDLAKIHTDASFYNALKKDTQTNLDEMTNDYKSDARTHLQNGETNNLKKDLFNIPSNLYPGDPSNNMSIQGNLDPPRKKTTTGGRSNDATDQAKALYKKYQGDGLSISSDDPTSLIAKSSDKLPNTDENYVTM